MKMKKERDFLDLI